MGERVRAVGDDPSLAPVAHCAALDVSASAAGQTSDRRECPCSDPAVRARELRLGLPPHPGRTLRARYPDRRQHGVDNSPAGRHRSRSAPVVGDVARVPARTGQRDRRLRLLQCVDTVLFRRLYALVFIELATRNVYLAGVTANPTGEWATQQARNIVETFVERSEPIRFLIHDRDNKFTAAFDKVFRSEGIRAVRTPVRAPRANAYIERWIGTVRRECLDRLLIVNRRHLERVLPAYIHHYNAHRPHRSLSQRPPTQALPSATETVAALDRVRRRDVLGGLIHEYNAAA
jgi:transposase InsO family protein